MPVVNNIPDLLQDALTKHNLTQRELALLLNINSGTLSRWLRGERMSSITLDNLNSICAILNVTPNDCLWIDDNNAPANEHVSHG